LGGEAMKEWLIGLVVVTFFAVGFVYIQGYFQTSYNLVDDIQLSADYNVYNETNEIVTGSSRDLMNQTTTGGSASESTIQGAWATIRNLPRVVPITARLLSRANTDLGLPAWMFPLFITMIVIAIVMWMIYWIAGLIRPKA
jgi:hypothetical protein